MVQAAALVGVSRIIVIERLPERRAIAQALGATDLADPEAIDPAQYVRDATAGRGADIALEAGGTLDGVELVPALARAGGTVVLTSMAWPGDKVSFPALDITVSGKRLLSSQSGGGRLRRDIPAYAGLLRDGTLDATRILSRTFALDEVGQAFSAARGKEVITGVLLPQR
jgi:S-(hydroxymethyl)glutathione dehydrogenase/alcohol dehydrogenase